MSSYDPVPVSSSSGRRAVYQAPSHEGLITAEQFKESMRFVRMQIAVPISVLIAMGANLVCALALKPGLAGINVRYPTLVSPNSIMIGLYWAVLYCLQVGFCLVLLLARKDVTKETLVYGVGIRFAVANWLLAAWAVSFTLQAFAVAEILILLNVVNLLTIHLTLLKYPPTMKRPLDTIFIHAPMALLLAILFEVDWVHNGFIALNWRIHDRSDRDDYTWQAVAFIASVNIVAALWEGIRRQYLMTGASIYLLFTLMFASPRGDPDLPSSALPKPTPVLVVSIACLVLHVVALIAGLAWKRMRDREGRIRLEEEVERMEREEYEARDH
ncbi:hypothetical protein BD324DRAFT_614396 [Kockovaella imperatae]|uniref:Uncharacterized protein n=1 Tax=Kockovaella imperatae TaxID=4999 RepID=A0A1Y1UQ93_9TREE|nr:hypothetical protein BD324DRAFT_614396 [Kockovaella imperatae]ORX39626.1 hypothetical protein BD324DRAFT_614396 [Kockovaella imperatae]